MEYLTKESSEQACEPRSSLQLLNIFNNQIINNYEMIKHFFHKKD